MVLYVNYDIIFFSLNKDKLHLDTILKLISLILICSRDIAQF